MNDQSEILAKALVGARAAGGGLTEYPGEVPADSAAAYAVQDAAIRLWSDEIVGWKIGYIQPHLQDEAGVDRLVGPVWRTQVAHDLSASSEVHAQIFGTGFAAAEAEFVVELLDDLEIGRTDWTPDEAAGIPTRLRIGLEVASSPVPDINGVGPRAVISDFGNNNGLVLGPEIRDWSADALDSIKITTRIEGVEVGTGTASNLPGGIHASLAQAYGILTRRGIPLKAGTLLATGALTGIHDLGLGQRAEVTFDPIGTLRCTAISASPKS